jgi:hypothetical protein
MNEARQAAREVCVAAMSEGPTDPLSEDYSGGFRDGFDAGADWQAARWPRYEVLAQLTAENQRLRAALEACVAALGDCISEVEGKAYLKDYVKAAYDDAIAQARAALEPQP